MTDFLSNWFQIGPIPMDALVGKYNYTLVVLSYVVAVLASYVALNIVGRLRAEQNYKARLYWLAGGAFSMGAGIWSMHFIGMLAFILPMPMMYEFGWTSFSLLIAILASAFALFILQRKGGTVTSLIGCGLILGLAISAMHYSGMEGMKIHVNIHYDPFLFFLSIAIGIFAAEAAIWLALQTNQQLGARQLPLQLISALVMGLAICGLHYTGMAAAVFTPQPHQNMMPAEAINPNYLAFFIAGITILVASLALTASTYYKKMVLAVQNEKEFLNVMLDNLKDGIIACNESGEITVLNHALQENLTAPMLKKPIKELFEQFILLGPDEKQISSQDFSTALNVEEKAVHLDNLVLKFKNNIMRNVIIDGQRIINSEGKNLGIVIVVHDVTDLKKTEKLKNEFVSIVSHELRTPLTSIRGSLGLLVSGMLGTFPEKAQKLLEIANNNCERLLLLINDILDIEKIEAGKMNFELKPYEVNRLVRESIEANQMYADKYKVKLQFNPVPTPHYIKVDSGRFMQVLTNLISNACKFSPPDSEIQVNVEERKNNIQISVIDKGPGISAEFQQRIFQKFSQADSSDTRGKGGTGLGLNISKTIIEKMGGSLNFVSLPNEGATFYFCLPIITNIEEKPKVAIEDKKRLLVCDDDEDQAQYLKVLLESAGYTVDLAYTVAQAKILIAKNKYKSLLLDLILPDQDGISFIRELREDSKTADLHIIVLSVIAQTGQKILNGEAVSVVDWLDKPIDLNKLLGSITKIKKDKATGRPNILHIEDNIETQHIVGTLLEKYAAVSTANNLKTAQEMLNKNHYDLIILDLLLPDGNALEILPLLARHTTPILVFSNMELNQDYSKFVSQALLKSNSSNDLLLQTIRNLL